MAESVVMKGVTAKGHNLGSLVSDKKPKNPKSITSPENGKKGGRPTSEQTIIKRGLKALVDDQLAKEVDVKITDPKTGKTVIVKKPQIVLILEAMFKKAYTKDDLGAMNAFLDRALGKPAQPMRGDGDSDTPIRVQLDYMSALRKGYGHKLDKEDD